jgi:hypothetical protein
MPAWLAPTVLMTEPVGQLVQGPPVSLYVSWAHTVQLVFTDERARDPVPAGQSSMPLPADELVPTGPLPMQYLFGGQSSGESLSGSPGM